MAFGGFNDTKHGAPMAEINVTPMVDVMLVLLVIFILSAPLFTHAIRLELPQAKSAPAPQKAETISLSIDGEGIIYWDENVVSQNELETRLTAAARQPTQPEVQLRADKATRYEVIAQVMAAAQNNGLTKIGFITSPGTAAAGKAGASESQTAAGK